MDNKDLLEYLSDNSDVIVVFKEKALDYLNAKNKRRAPAKRHNETVVNREAEKMIDQLMDSIYSKIKAGVNPNQYTPREDWIKFMDENNIIENLEDTVNEMELQ